MPTVLRFSAYRVAVYPNDHRPPHVHVIGNGCEAVFELNCAIGPMELRENYGFGRRELANIERELNRNMALLCGAWSDIHGEE